MADKVYTLAQVKTHNTPEDAWVIIEGKIYNVTKFGRVHPGGSKMLLDLAGQDVTKNFNYFHAKRVLDKYHKKLYVGDLHEYREKMSRRAEKRGLYGQPKPDLFGELVPYGDPTWYQGWKSPYYNDSHRRFREASRKFIEEEVKPNISKWVENQEIPMSLSKHMASLGFYQTGIKGVWFTEYFGDVIPGGVKPEEWNWHHYLAGLCETTRVGTLSIVWGVYGGLGIGLPPVLNFGSQYLKDQIVADCAHARKYIALAVTEPWAGSDVGNIQTTARKSEDGKYYIVNGAKKWITGGLWADYFTSAVRTGGPGMKGISMMAIPRDLPGVTVKKMKCQGMWASGTSYIVFEDVKVPAEYLIGKEGKGFKYIMSNFNTERFAIVGQALGSARCAYEEAFKYANKRRTFGKKLIDHAVIRNKLGHMIRQIEGLQNWAEQIAEQLNTLSDIEKMLLGGPIGLCKAHATTVYEFCAREALQIFGGNGYTRGGQGEKVERLYRDVRGVAIPGGSEEIMLDLAMRQAQQFMPSTAKL
mmetsp:Transcript_43427/g.49967  ORF Transcript_43427/g.49967 Transcript_43427/m.49967 type:complete len:528 (+) Transcript_43427:237-1820(+)|eukprot:CAMPEP_0115005490 /NCGR_PEP_ID=MMETSP0216-20121206/19901_1 /TAXON_ID=223996 /ORGANISM="Protocruzia adherens, Strain Boccale" /LENGTH=527 /DNA_ID=CAMNT_0002371823 /DNA_START=111 /DNA_END=1694 /DNA_ORIENTATION=+